MYSKEQENKYNKLVEIIFERKYEIRIKTIDNINIEDVALYGTYTTGDKEYDKILREELITRWLSINEMVEFFKKGKPFRIVNINDSEEIYNTIHEYLLCWEQRIKYSLNIGNAPINDLLDLDAFASKVHGYACITMQVQRTQSSLMNYFNSVGLGRKNIMSTVVEEDNAPRKHNSLAEIFSEAIMGNRG